MQRKEFENRIKSLLPKAADKVEEIERKRREAFEKEMEKA